MADPENKMPVWVWALLGLMGGGTVTGGGMGILDRSDQTLQNEVDSLKGQVYNLQETNKEILIKLGGCK